MAIPEATDVLVVGGGPAGLLIGLGLAQQGIHTVIVEKRSLKSQEKLGRACTLYPRTLELLEQMDVADDIVANAFIGQTYAAFANGERVARKAWQAMLPLMDNSFHNYITNIRQNKSQSIIAERYKSEFGDREVYYECELVRYWLENNPNDQCNVTAELCHASGKSQMLRCKYLVGADGGRSSVRQAAGIAMEGNDTAFQWVRLDGLFKTDIPNPNVVFASIESPTHGQLLWARLDQDAYRLGFSLSPSMQGRYPAGPTEDEAKHEAIEALKPFKLDIQRLDWWTHYSVQQKVAQTLQKDEFVFLAGDAAHTHSSAFAQGMNTAVHDACNLVWKLSGQIKGWYRPEVLTTYNKERHQAAEKLIAIDRAAAQAVSALASASPGATGSDAQTMLRSAMETNMSYTVGLGISYDEIPSVLLGSLSCSTLLAGMRSPDALLYAPGPSVPIRLHQILHKGNDGRWNILVFAGSPNGRSHGKNKPRGADVALLRDALESTGGLKQQHEHKIRMATISTEIVPCAWDAFHGPAIGRLLFDPQKVAHGRFGIDEENGGVVVIRPDGIVALGVALDELDRMESFFHHIFA